MYNLVVKIKKTLKKLGKTYLILPLLALTGYATGCSGKKTVMVQAYSAKDIDVSSTKLLNVAEYYKTKADSFLSKATFKSDYGKAMYDSAGYAIDEQIKTLARITLRVANGKNNLEKVTKTQWTKLLENARIATDELAEIKIDPSLRYHGQQGEDVSYIFDVLKNEDTKTTARKIILAEKILLESRFETIPYQNVKITNFSGTSKNQWNKKRVDFKKRDIYLKEFF